MHRAPEWMRYVLLGAGTVCLLLTALGCWSPSRLGITATGPWAALLAGVGVAYGIALLVTSWDPIRFWPVVGMGLVMIGSVAVQQGLQGAWPVVAGVTLAGVPFALMLKSAYDQFIGSQRVCCPDVQRMALRAKTQHGVSLDELSRLSPILVVFLRHFGCPFCRETLEDLKAQRKAIEEGGTRIVLVHMVDSSEAAQVLARYGLAGLDHVSDPCQTVYKAFGLGRGRLSAILGPREWWNGIRSVFDGRGIGMIRQDAFQMPGAFLLFHGQVLNAFRHQSASDRPDYLDLASGGGMMFPTR